ncbi:Structural maintenance of chromosomes protein 4 [Leucoagaricus sp. SymC.cos]|nr:Structural maintenance of chromosomes protein 4 [Leucoagaricus sp. SymC.cos]
MPPRRSSRSTRASVEPASVESLPAKRKRGSTVEPTIEEKENVAKPPSSKRSSSVRATAPAAKGRTSRSKTLPKVEESGGEEEEEEVEAPAKKKVRPSVEAEDEAVEAVEEEREKEDVKPQVRGRRSKKTVVEDADDEESEAAPSKGSKTGPQVRRSKARVSIEEPPKQEDRVEDDIETIPSTKSKKSPPLSQPEPSQPPTAEEEEEFALIDPIPMPAPEALAQAVPEQPSGPVARLVIHKIVLVNFKSYAGRQEIGPFHKSFSAIVGPNGSGKSNTIDALLFVFGYRASKMRQAKVSELIHNSANYPNLNECSVEVHFREIIDMPGPDAFKIVPNSQLVVSRHAYKNNSSTYMMNGQGSSFTDVRNLLKGRGIDLDHNRFLILQVSGKNCPRNRNSRIIFKGEVESIAQMKSKAPSEHEDGLLEYLEDIIGTSEYKQQIDDAFKALETHAEERVKALNRLKFVEREKANLEEEKREAENYLRMKNELVRAQSRPKRPIRIKRYDHREISREQLMQEPMQTKLRKDLAAEEEKNRDDVTHLEMLKDHYKEREETYQEVKEAADGARKELTGKEKQEVQLQEKLKHANGKAKKLKKQIADDKASQKQAGRDLEDNTDKIKRGKAKLSKQEAELEEEEKILEVIRDGLKGNKTQTFHDQIEAKQKELQPWTTKINAKKTAVDIAKSERDALAEKAEAIERGEKEAEENLATKRRDQQAAKKRRKEKPAKASSARQKVEEARASQSENKSQGKVLDSLQRLKSRGQIQGFHARGRLGSLGAIDEKYDIAVSTACGQLNHLVVDTVEQAQQCIEYLRAQNIGRATFMVLEKIPQDSGMNRIQTPENAPRLFDLIKPKEPRFAPAFYKALRDTLVANDLDQANRIAYGATRWRVVTLAGQMFETSGTMSGGGGQPSRGGMSSKFAAEAVRPEVMRQYEKDSEDASMKLNQAMKEAGEADAALENFRKMGPELEMSFQKLGLEIETGKRAISEAEKRLRDVKAQNKPNQGDLRRISALDAEIESTTAELDQLQAKAAKIEEAIEALEKRILAIGGSQLLSQKSKVEGIKFTMGLTNEEITRAEVATVKAEKDIGKFASSIEANEGSLEESEGEVDELQKTLGTLQTYLNELRAKCDDAQQAAENSKEDLDQLKKELDAKEEQIQEYLKTKQALEREIQDIQKELKTNGELIAHWQSQHDQLALEDVDEDDDDDDEEDEAEGASKGDGEAQAEGDGGENTEVKPDPDGPAKKSTQVLHEYTPDELAPLRKRDLTADVELLDEKIKRLNPDLNVLKEYKRREAEFDNRAKELDRVTELRDQQKAEYDNLRKQRLDEFMTGFTQISSKLKEMYPSLSILNSNQTRLQMITLGGNAELELVDSLDPFSEGIIFSVMPPKKSWKNISNLSGGEKTLSSLALVFALHHFKPTPLYFMDEIDAALDFRNVSIVANYIKDRTKNAQFIIISLRNDMFELSSRLIGIYKTNNTTKSEYLPFLSLKLLADVISGVCISNRDRAVMERKLREAQRQQQQLRTPQRKQFSSQKQLQTPLHNLSTASQM